MEADGGETESRKKKAVETIATWLRGFGINGPKSELEKHINAWKACAIKIAVIGESGTGKSSFVNAMLGLKAEDDHAAKTGTVETTMTIKRFPHPEHSNLEFWDLPGVGTTTFPRRTYLTIIDIEKYDFFILTSCSRFRENDSWLATEIMSRGKKFYFVRTMIDIDLLKDKKAHPRRHNAEAVIKSIELECRQKLKEANIDNPQLFMVDNTSPQLYEFGKLQLQLIKDAPKIKQDAIVFSFSATSRQMLDKKLEVLKERVFMTGVLATLGSLIPIPGVGVSINYSIMQSETAFYQSQMGTDEISLNELALKMDIELRQLTEDIHLKAGLVMKTKDAFVNFCKESTAQKKIDVIAKLVFPILGSLYAAITAYPASVAIQKALLKICYEDACRLIDYQLKWFKENSQ